MILKTFMIDVIILRINKQMFSLGKISISVRFVEKEILELKRSEGCGVSIEYPLHQKTSDQFKRGGRGYSHLKEIIFNKKLENFILI